MTSSRSRRAADRLFPVAVLLLALSVVSSRHQESDGGTRRLSNAVDLSALRSASRRHLAPTEDNKRSSWRKNRVRVWGKRIDETGDVDDDDIDGDKRGWRKNTVRVWGKRGRGLTSADRRAWAGNTIRVWGKRLNSKHLPEQVLNAAAASYKAAPKRSVDGVGPRYSAEVFPVTLNGDERQAATRSRRSTSGYGKRWVVRRAVRSRPRWVAMGGPKRSWRTNVIRVWGKRAS